MKKKFDKTLFIAVISLAIFGLLMIYSSSSIWAEYKFNDSFHYVTYQAIFFVVGLFLMIFISKIDYRFYKKFYKNSNFFHKISNIVKICIII